MALINTIRKISNPDGNFLQQSVRDFIGQIKDFPFFTGELIEGVEISTSSAGTTINHRLDREPVGFIIVDVLQNTRIWRLGKDARTITLRANNTATISLWVF